VERHSPVAVPYRTLVAVASVSCLEEGKNRRRGGSVGICCCGGTLAWGRGAVARLSALLPIFMVWESMHQYCKTTKLTPNKLGDRDESLVKRTRGRPAVTATRCSVGVCHIVEALYMSFSRVVVVVESF
jgi:hypothetical protein